MNILLISDVHSNLEALEAVLNKASYDQVLFMGDVVDYGPNPKEVLDVLQYTGAKRVLGNHDVAAVLRNDCRSSKAMHEASVVTRSKITWKLLPGKSLDALGKAERKINLEIDGLKIRMIHGAPGDELYYYLSKEEAEKLELDIDLLLLGHTHIAYEIKNAHKWIINPGSVGMPKDGNPNASYAIINTDRREATFGRANYDVDLMLSKLKSLLKDDQRIYDQLEKVYKTGKS